MSSSNVNIESDQVANEDATSAIGSSEATASDEVRLTAAQAKPASGSAKINDEAIVATTERKEAFAVSSESLDSTCIEESSCPILEESEETTSFIENTTQPETSTNEHNA